MLLMMSDAGGLCGHVRHAEDRTVIAPAAGENRHRRDRRRPGGGARAGGHVDSGSCGSDAGNKPSWIAAASDSSFSICFLSSVSRNAQAFSKATTAWARPWRTRNSAWPNEAGRAAAETDDAERRRRGLQREQHFDACWTTRLGGPSSRSPTAAASGRGLERRAHHLEIGQPQARWRTTGGWPGFRPRRGTG